MGAFTVYPAIDLRRGRVVRLAQGDPGRQTVYGDDPTAVAERWLAEGARWLHVVDLDGAFGEAGEENGEALGAVLAVAERVGGRVQFGGGLRKVDDLARLRSLGASRVVLGTAAVEDPILLREALRRFGPGWVAVGVDARSGRVRVRGWMEDAGVDALDLARRLRQDGVTTVVFTDVARDGVGAGVDVAGARRLAEEAGLEVIASGGAASLDDVRRVRAAGLGGVVIGRALYEGRISLSEALRC